MLREEQPEVQVEVLDSQSATMAEGFVVIEAARAAARGADLPGSSLTRARSMPTRRHSSPSSTRWSIWREAAACRGIQAWASALLSVKPIIELRQQDIHLVTRTPHATARRRPAHPHPGAARACEANKLHLCVQHTNALEEAQQLAR